MGNLNLHTNGVSCIISFMNASQKTQLIVACLIALICFLFVTVYNRTLSSKIYAYPISFLLFLCTLEKYIWFFCFICKLENGHENAIFEDPNIAVAIILFMILDFIFGYLIFITIYKPVVNGKNAKLDKMVIYLLMFYILRYSFLTWLSLLKSLPFPLAELSKLEFFTVIFSLYLLYYIWAEIRKALADICSST